MTINLLELEQSKEVGTGKEEISSKRNLSSEIIKFIVELSVLVCCVTSKADVRLTVSNSSYRLLCSTS